MPGTVGGFTYLSIHLSIELGSRVGYGHQKDQAMIRNLTFLAQPPVASLMRGEELGMELITDHAYKRKPPSNPQSTGLGEPPGG